MNIGITGNIACGKSTVSNYLKKRGYVIIDADKIGHNILLNENVKREIALSFGEDVLENNEIDRKKLGKIVFNNKESLKILNNITHPEIRKIIAEKQNEYKDEKLVFLDAALLYEANFQDLVSKVIVVSVDKNTQIKRLRKRNSLSKEEALKRINSQMSASEKERRGNYIINNNNSFESTYNQVDEIIRNIEKEV